MRPILTVLCWMLTPIGMASADNLTLKLEGGLGFIDFKDTGQFLLEVGTPPSDTEFGERIGGMHRGPQSLSHRAELDWDVALASGKTLRLGLIASGLHGTDSEETPVYSWMDTNVRYEADGIFSVAQTTTRVCPFVDGQPDACGTFRGNLDRSYAEIMPQVLLGSQENGTYRTWFGLQGFSGKLDERTSGLVENTFYTPVERITELDARANGLLVAFQRESTLKSGARLTLGLGLGGYRMSTASNAYNAGERNPNATRHYSFNGARAQASIGLEIPLNDALSLGGTIRADYWSAQPRVNLDLSEPDCTGRTSCRGLAPSTSGLSGATDPLLSVSVGVSLTLQM